MAKQKFQDAMLLVSRLVIAAIFLYHGIPKLMDMSATAGFFTTLGLPGFLGPLVGIVEVVASILLIAGIWHMWANYALGLIMVGALVTVHLRGLSDIKPGLERDVLILVVTLVLAAFGPGKYSFSKKK